MTLDLLRSRGRTQTPDICMCYACLCGLHHRNAAEFDPTQLLNGTTANSTAWSWETLVLDPTLQAVIAAVTSTGSQSSVKVSIGFGGELGRSFTVYASKWETLARKVQKTLKGKVARVAAGPHFDPLKLCG